MPNAVIDMDGLRQAWPSPPGDRFNLTMALRNLRPVARNYFDAGAVRIVLAGVIETQVDRDRYPAALGVPLTVCRLRVDLPVIRARLARRHEVESGALQWHLDRSRSAGTVSPQKCSARIVTRFWPSATSCPFSTTRAPNGSPPFETFCVASSIARAIQRASASSTRSAAVSVAVMRTGPIRHCSKGRRIGKEPESRTCRGHLHSLRPPRRVHPARGHG